MQRKSGEVHGESETPTGGCRGEEAWKTSLLKTDRKSKKRKLPGFVGTCGPPRETERSKAVQENLRPVTDSIEHHAKGKEFYSGNDEKPF